MAVATDIERMSYTVTPAPAGSLFDDFANQVMRRVEDVIAGRDCPFPPQTQQVRFLHLLRTHQGKQRAVPLGEFAERLGMTPREVKGLVADLRMTFRVQIGSSRSGDTGYYLIQSAEECFESTAPMYAQALSELRVVRRMRGGAQTIEQMLSQIALDLNESEAR